MTEHPEVALRRGLDYLRRTQHPAGSWTDFWLPVGTSDAWVTAFTGLALHAVSVCAWLPAGLRAEADTAARHAARWLRTQAHPRGGWGYHRAVSADADSTAHALSLLARLGQPVPASALTFLRAHQGAGAGFGTYAWPGPAHAWTRPSPDVTAAALRALHDLGELTSAELGVAWAATLTPQQRHDGLWEGLWWVTTAYPTGLVLEVWDAGRTPLERRPPFPAAEHAFDLAWQLRAQQVTGQPEAAQTTTFLLRRQAADGAWPSTAQLRVPPAHPTSGGVTLRAGDDRRVFTTASALRSLALGPPAPARTRARPRRPDPAPPAPHPLRRVFGQVAQTSGLAQFQAQAAQRVFDQLTRLSLRSPSPWPSRQLTALSGGMPLEFSAVVGAGVRPALRYAAEVADPFLAPPQRLRGGLQVLHEVACGLGYQEGWRRLWPALQLLADAVRRAPDGLRFTLWAGVDQAAAPPSGAAPPPGLKVYLNTLHRELGGGRGRVEAALEAAALPISDAARRALDLLDGGGFPQEVGFGLGPGGQLACKVYYELPGWPRDLARRVLDLSDLPGAVDDLTPEVPGLIRAGLAAKSRAGLALRLDPHRGQISEITSACAFPIPLLPLGTTMARVETWLAQHSADPRPGAEQPDPAPYRALADTLRPTWPDGQPETRAMHSLFTRTLTRQHLRTTVYLRPYLSAADDGAEALPGRAGHGRQRGE